MSVTKFVFILIKIVEKIILILTLIVEKLNLFLNISSVYYPVLSHFTQ